MPRLKYKTEEERQQARKEAFHRYRTSDKGREMYRVKSAEWRAKYPNKKLFGLAWSRAKEKQVPFSLSYKDIIIPEKCPVFGTPLTVAKGQARPDSPTLDRIIPQLGYTPENVRVISRRANELKSNASVEELEAVARWVRREVNRISQECDNACN